MANRIHSTGLRRPIGRRRSVEAGDHEVLVDAWTRQVRAGLSGPLSGLYPALARPVGNPS